MNSTLECNYLDGLWRRENITGFYVNQPNQHTHKHGNTQQLQKVNKQGEKKKSRIKKILEK